MDELELATKHIKRAYKLAGDDIGSLREKDFQALCYHLHRAVSLIDQNTKIPVDSYLVDADIIINVFNTHFPDWKKKTKKRHITQKRQILAYLLRSFTNYSLHTISKLLGHKEHTTIVHSTQKVRDMLSVNDPLYVDMYNKAMHEIRLITHLPEENEEELPQEDELPETI